MAYHENLARSLAHLKGVDPEPIHPIMQADAGQQVLLPITTADTRQEAIAPTPQEQAQTQQE